MGRSGNNEPQWAAGGLFFALLIIGGVTYVGVTRISSVEANERTRCQEALKQGLEESTPGPGWEVVLKIPGKGHTPQRICSDPQIDREKKQVVCPADVAGVGSIREQELSRTVTWESNSPDGPEVAVLLEWSVR